MGKRSNFERVERDFYPTPLKAVEPLIPHLCHFMDDGYIEPCAGNYALCDHLSKFYFYPVLSSDIEPQHKFVQKMDALKLTHYLSGNTIITNPPWNRKILHPMIEHFRTVSSKTWLLFDADWMHTKQAIPYMEYCEKIVSVGRVKWIPNSKMTGKDNCCWYLFRDFKTKTIFYTNNRKK